MEISENRIREIINKILLDRKTSELQVGFDLGLGHNHDGVNSKFLVKRWATWTPSAGGWAGSPTIVARWSQVDKIVTCLISITGASSAVNTTFVLPVASKITMAIPIARAMNNGSWFDGHPWLQITAGSTSVVCYSTGAGGLWAGANGKFIYAVFNYEVA